MFAPTANSMRGMVKNLLPRRIGASCGFHMELGTSGVSNEYLERLYDEDVRGFLNRVRTGVFEQDNDFRSMFCNFQRYLSHLRTDEIVELLEVLSFRNIRENHDDIDLCLLLVCEANRRMLSIKSRLFSLKQIQRICTVLKGLKFNRPSFLLAPRQHALGSSGNNSTEIVTGFEVVTSDNIGKYNGSVSDILDTRHVTETQVSPSAPSMKEGEKASCSGQVDISNISQNDNSSSGKLSSLCECISVTPEAHNVVEPNGTRQRLEPSELFLENYRQVNVPICEVNVGNTKLYLACSKCVNKYGILLHLSGFDHLTVFISLMGKSIIQQSCDIQKKHENAVVSYMTLSSHLNCTLNAHLLGAIMAHYRAAFMRSKSLRNIAIALQSISKCRVTRNHIASGLIERLSDTGSFERLCAKERSLGTLLVAFNQIITFLMSCNDLPVSGKRKRVAINLLTYLVGNYSRLFCNDGVDEDTVNSVKGNVKQLVDNLELKGICMESILVPSEVEELQKILSDGKTEYFKDFRTSDLHKQVVSALSALGREAKDEVYINPHFCDVVFSKTVIEIDGPYHFTTGLTSSINRVLKRQVDRYMLHYARNSIVKDFMLGAKGYKVIHIPYFRWPSSKQAQLAYLRQLLA